MKYYHNANIKGFYTFSKTQLTSSSWGGTSSNKGKNGVEVFRTTTAAAQLQSDYKMDFRLINFSGITAADA